VAFKVDATVPGVLQHVVGTKHTLGNFAIKVETDGTVKLVLNNNNSASGSLKVVAGDTVVVGVTYKASTGDYQLWESKGNSLKTGTQTANFNYANGNELRLGEANTTSGSTEYLRGMVGEVKIYNHVLSVGDFVTERNAMVSKWIDGASTSSWRVIPEDATYPTDDIIVAYCAVTDPVYSLPADPASTDCTASFQAALDAASAAGGGTVFVPAGEYRINGTLRIDSNVILRGRWREINATQPASGTILALYNT
jgi:hypothetical protein